MRRSLHCSLFVVRIELHETRSVTNVRKLREKRAHGTAAMRVEELRPRLWRWTAAHPEWTPETSGPDGWEPEVSSYGLVDDDALVLIDPLVPADDEARFWRALDGDVEHHGPPQIILTVFYHARSTRTIAERYRGSRVFAPAAAEAQARERVEVAEVYGGGDALPGGIEARTTEHRAEAVLWIPAHHALAAGDLLLGTADGGVRVVPDSWLRPGVTPAQIREGLRPLLDLPVVLLLLTHGEPVLADARARLEAAIG
jgi:glyoxylase-like metal-dependent hydrolase (beta-lactamase superfamily II)